MTENLIKVIIRTTSGRTLVFFNVIAIDDTRSDRIKFCYLKRKTKAPGSATFFTDHIQVYYTSDQDAPVFGDTEESKELDEADVTEE